MCNVCTSVTPGEPQIFLGSDRAFTYDYVFDMEDSQETVYNTCVASLVESALEGYNATVLAYGQTGSGKTYTMGTGFDIDLNASQVGIIPRAVEHLFHGIDSKIKTARENGMVAPEFQIMVQFMELYNEEVIDLFNPIFNKEKLYKIHEDPFTGIQVKGIMLKTVMSAEATLQCLRMGALSRTTASTQMNTHSSRSHAIFTVHVKQQRLVPSDDGSNEVETLTSKFHFVDLAGSERLKRTGATGNRAKEGISINCGLLALGNVISALGDPSRKALHIPYRDSKLTRLLQDSLGGNSKTVMIACISPSDRDFMETLNTLKYANRARNIKNKVLINQSKSSRTIAQLRQQIAQLQLELMEYKQGKRIIGQDGNEIVNDMFYENNMLQNELNNLRTRVKAMQETVENLSARNAALLTEKAAKNWIGTGTDSQVADMIQGYLQEIEELQAKLMESNSTCELLRKQLAKYQSTSMYNKLSMDMSLGDISLVLEEAKKELKLQKESLIKSKSHSMSEVDSDSSTDVDFESDNESKDIDADLKQELLNITTDIDMKQKLIDELELSQRRMQTMKQHYEEKLLQLQSRIKSTQEERDKMLQSYSVKSDNDDNVKKVKEEYSRKISEMQKELKKLQAAQKEHARLLRNQNEQKNKLQLLKNELTDMKRAKVKLINKMKEESQRHKEAERNQIREIAQLRKESRKKASLLRAMEAECKIKEQVLKRKQEEVSLLRKNQMRGLSAKAAGRIKNEFSEKAVKRKWSQIEKAINNIAMNRSGLVQQEVRMEHFLEKREALGRELEILHHRRKQALAKSQDTTQLESLIEDVEENIKYVQETIAEAQQNVMEIEETQDESEENNIQKIITSLQDVNEAKYLIQKLYGMTLNHSHLVAQREAKLKENEATLEELKQENAVKGQLLDHILHTEYPVFNREIAPLSTSSNTNETSSNNTSRSTSPIPLAVPENKSKIRKRTADPSELLFGLKSETNIMTKSENGNHLQLEQPLKRIPSSPGILKDERL
ncbi:kinesin-like protein KIF21A isoform X2 [Agrilus planipennis]|nr:kinesin-like protein KIF21A isoform X2 [Agrilus planipennis]